MNSDKGPISLYELNKSIQVELKNVFCNSYWIIAEINEVKENNSGHCYIELIEKEEGNGNIIARSRATIWSYTWKNLKPFFEITAQHAFTEGIKVMLKITVEFHELYGLSLNVTDIDPVYTLGDLQKQKQETIEKLKQEGVFNMNKELKLTEVPQRIAVISSKTAAGLGDFINQLEKNAYSYKFYIKLFPAVMQGEGAEQAIIDALEKIFEKESAFDVVVIIRGGGSKTDLSCFDRYWLAYHVAQFPVPVLTGIGHEQDDTVTDMVAHTRLKTPTAVAAFLIEKVASFEYILDEQYNTLKEIVAGQLNKEHKLLFNFSAELYSAIKLTMQKNKTCLQKYTTELKNSSILKLITEKQTHKQLIYKLQYYSTGLIKRNEHSYRQYMQLLKSTLHYKFKENNNAIRNYRHTLQLLDPQQVLNRGYSITTKNGKLIKSREEVMHGEVIETRLKKGKIKSIIK